MPDKTLVYETSDIYFAAFLNALGHGLKTTNRYEEKGKEKTKFVFELPESQVEKLKASFFGGTGEVKALTYMHSLRSLKSLCFI